MNEANQTLKKLFVGSSDSSQLVLARLEKAGINAVVSNHLYSNVAVDHQSNNQQSLELLVRAHELKAAMKVLSQLIDEDKLF